MRVTRVDTDLHFFQVEHIQTETTESLKEWLHPTSLVLKTTEEHYSNSIRWNEIKFEKLLPKIDNIQDVENLRLIQPKVTTRNKVLITMENLPQILTNPLDAKMPPEFHTYPPIIIPLVFSKYYGNWQRHRITNQNFDGVNRVYYTYNAQKVETQKQLLKCIDHCNKQVYKKLKI